ncbi:hypothetical protein KXV20_001241 [Aspergillus fumigatus]|nr:hypothetical protein KXX60_002970 [Aspergillus fumigatus]KAH2633303.1 hypothetical protein KXV20_001241 [Aspergillus fumigatus]
MKLILTGDQVYDPLAASVKAVSCMGIVVVCVNLYAHTGVVAYGTNVGCGSGNSALSGTSEELDTPHIPRKKFFFLGKA